MFTAFASLAVGNESFIGLCLMGGLLLWVFYMMTFRTDDWLRLVKDEQERKAKRQERTDALLKRTGQTIKWWLNK